MPKHFRVPGTRTVLDLATLDDPQVPDSEKAALTQFLEELERLFSENPLHKFEPHPKQAPFLAARTPIQAAFAGNRFGKTTALVIKCLIQHTPLDALPPHLRPYKHVSEDTPTQGRLLAPSEQAFQKNIIPTLQEWVPGYLLLGGRWDKAWDKQFGVLRFRDGGSLETYTYVQDPAVMAGSARDYIAYDEPPPEATRNECLARLIDRDGFEMFAMTPINMQGSGIGWIFRKIWKRREAPDVTVIKGSGHDNPTLTPAVLERVLSQYPDEERQAREFGDFLHTGGLIYPGGFESVLIDSPDPSQIKDMDIVVGIDPGFRNAAFVWVAFDQDNKAFVFDEALVKSGIPTDYTKAIRQVNSRWQVQKPIYVIDPSARNRSLQTGESILTEIQRQGIYPILGENNVYAGVTQVRHRLKWQMLSVSKECRHLRDEADEYRQDDTRSNRAEEQGAGDFKVVKENDHHLDSLRYVLMSRPWYVRHEREDKDLGWEPGTAPSADRLASWIREPETPMGSYT